MKKVDINKRIPVGIFNSKGVVSGILILNKKKTSHHFKNSRVLLFLKLESKKVEKCKKVKLLEGKKRRKNSSDYEVITVLLLMLY